MSRIPDESCTLSKRRRAFPDGVWGRVRRGAGGWLELEDGRVYWDWLCALGALTVGHAHPHVVEAVTKQMAAGAIFSLPSVLEEQVAERLCDVIPCAEQVKFVKTGSEACSAAVRIARLATGRDLIATTSSSYHGWHDAMIAAKDRHPGVPLAFEETIGTFSYNDMDSLRNGFDATDVAAVILEPVQGDEPRDEFLQHVIEWAHEGGAVVIFDEMLSGGRLAVGGAQEHYSVTPDLATFGKAFGGGLPLAFVCGKADLMKHAWPVSGTFSGDALALAACNAMLDLYRDEKVVEKLWINGAGPFAMFVKLAYESGVMTVKGHPPRWWLEFAPSVDRRLFMSVFAQQCADEGVLVHPAVFFASAALSPSAVNFSMDVMKEAWTYALDGLSCGDPDGLKARLSGQQYEDSVR